jgi:hypothetical protein
MVRLTRFSVVALTSLSSGDQLVNAHFSVHDPSSLDSSVGKSCAEALLAPVNCAPIVQTFQQLSYRTSLDVALTDSICTASCAFSLKSWFDTVSTQCAGKAVGGGIPTRFGGYMWAGFNETCVKDSRPPHTYCNSMFAKS